MGTESVRTDADRAIRGREDQREATGEGRYLNGAGHWLLGATAQRGVGGAHAAELV